MSGACPTCAHRLVTDNRSSFVRIPIPRFAACFQIRSRSPSTSWHHCRPTLYYASHGASAPTGDRNHNSANAADPHHGGGGGQWFLAPLAAGCNAEGGSKSFNLANRNAESGGHAALTDLVARRACQTKESSEYCEQSIIGHNWTVVDERGSCVKSMGLYMDRP
jgi:hypothetical protein